MPDIVQITDFDEKELDIYARCSENELLHYYEPDLGVFIAESPKVIERAMDAGYEVLSVLVQDTHIDGEAAPVIRRLSDDVKVYSAPFDVLAKLTGFKLVRGMLVAMRRRPLPSVESICKDAKRIVVLEDVENPTNVGAIFRSAAALGMDAVILTDTCTNPLYRRAERVSMGTVFQIPWTIFPKDKNWMENGIEYLKNMGFKSVAMALLDDSYNIDDQVIKKEEKLAVIMGAEGDGLLDSTIAKCDYTVCIPMQHDVDSLNVAAASAIAFWELGRH